MDAERQQAEAKAKEDMEATVSTNAKAIADLKAEVEDAITKIEITLKQEQTKDNSALLDRLNIVQNATVSNEGKIESLEKAGPEATKKWIREIDNFKMVAGIQRMLKLAKLEKMLEVERDFDGKLQGVCEDAIPLVMKVDSLQGVCEDAIPLVMKVDSLDIETKNNCQTKMKVHVEVEAEAKNETVAKTHSSEVTMYFNVVMCLFHNFYCLLSATFLGPIYWSNLQQTDSKQVSINMSQGTVCNKKVRIMFKYFENFENHKSFITSS